MSIELRNSQTNQSRIEEIKNNIVLAEEELADLRASDLDQKDFISGFITEPIVNGMLAISLSALLDKLEQVKYIEDASEAERTLSEIDASITKIIEKITLAENTGFDCTEAIGSSLEIIKKRAMKFKAQGKIYDLSHTTKPQLISARKP